MNIIDQTVQDIKEIKIQGATNIVKASLFALKEYVKANPKVLTSEFKSFIRLLMNARPTEPFAKNCLGSLINTIDRQERKTIDAIADIENLIQTVEEKIITNGVKILQGKNIILTHCHSSGVEKILIDIFSTNKNLTVFATETEPMHQGRITVQNLAAAGLNVTLITDSEAAFMVSHEDKQDIDAVLIGCDALLKDGSVYNKVGSYGICLSAWRSNIPLYIVSSLLKYTPVDLPLEERDTKEIWDKPPQNIKIINPVFDKVPARFITGLITESGVIKPEEAEAKVLEIYPWILEVHNN